MDVPEIQVRGDKSKPEVTNPNPRVGLLFPIRTGSCITTRAPETESKCNAVICTLPTED